MPIELIYTLGGIVFGAVLGFLFNWLNSVIILNRQETKRAKREIRKEVSKLIAKIRFNDFPKDKKLSFSLNNYTPILEEIFLSNKKYISKSVIKAYEYYKNPKKSQTPEFEMYDLNNSDAQKILHFPDKNGKEFAISNLKKIIDAVG